MIQIKTPRLILREWLDSDLAPFAEMNADPRVMEYFPATLSFTETQELVARFRRHFLEHGFGLFAVELKDSKEFIGFVGLSVPQFAAHFMPAVEIGWRIASKHFGQGYATEAAREVLEFAWEELQLKEVVSFTTESNLASRRVMEKIGMVRDVKDDFLHPKLDENHRLSKHVLYRIANPK